MKSGSPPPYLYDYYQFTNHGMSFAKIPLILSLELVTVILSWPSSNRTDLHLSQMNAMPSTQISLGKHGPSGSSLFNMNQQMFPQLNLGISLILDYQSGNYFTLFALQILFPSPSIGNVDGMMK